jgi:cell shape-determining protein MreC
MTVTTPNRFIRVENEPGLRKDRLTGTINNINKSEIKNAKERKRLLKLKKNEVEELKNEVSELKDLVNKLIEKL